MTTAKPAAVAAILALLATSAFGGECCGQGHSGYAPASGYGANFGQGYGGYGGGGGYGVDGQPGGYDARLGSPYHYSDGVPEAGYGGDVYSNHFGPGFHRNAQFGHYRFPYYSYRRPWYHVGPPAYGADTNFAW